MNTLKIIKLLVIGNDKWCKDFTAKFSDTTMYHLLIINDFNIALKRLQHNSYDILLLEEDYFNYLSIQLSQLSYAMSRPSIILCNSFFKYCIYKFWKMCSYWTNKYITSKLLIHIKMVNDSSLSKYLKTLLPQHNLIKKISNEIRSNFLMTNI